MSAFIDITGKKYGRLIAVEHVGTDKHHYACWKCRCECGNELFVSSAALRSGNTKSCGCYKNETVAKRMTKHGEYKTRLYGIWRDMLSRANGDNDHDSRLWKEYRGRGITVCDEWKEYESFASWAKSNGYADNLSIDRIDVNGNYEPNNCRWATMKQQANNKRTSRFVNINGEIKTVTEWCEIFGVNRMTAFARIDRLGWDPVDAVMKPPRAKRKNV